MDNSSVSHFIYYILSVGLIATSIVVFIDLLCCQAECNTLCFPWFLITVTLALFSFVFT